MSQTREVCNSDPRPVSSPVWRLGSRTLPDLPRPLVMGIVNLTPDSFYTSSRQPESTGAVKSALRLVHEGADLLDLGAESSRPGAEPVGAEEEQKRLLPVLRELRRHTEIPITVDTVRSNTAQLCLEAGADGINDISAGTHDPDMLQVVALAECGLVLMHMQGDPSTMQNDPHYTDVVTEVGSYLAARTRVATDAGIPAERIIVDPGIGFGKTLDHNLSLLAHLRDLSGLRPLLLGASRKGFIGKITGAPTAQRLPGSLAALGAAHEAGVAVVRVHDVAASIQFLDTLAAIAAS